MIVPARTRSLCPKHRICDMHAIERVLELDFSDTEHHVAGQWLFLMNEKRIRQEKQIHLRTLDGKVNAGNSISQIKSAIQSDGSIRYIHQEF